MEIFILSSWDNIVGPKTDKLFVINDEVITEIISSNMTNYSDVIKLNQSLLVGEMQSQFNYSTPISRIYISDSIIICALLFEMEQSTIFVHANIKRHCVSAVFFKCRSDFILYNASLIYAELSHIITELKIFQNMHNIIESMAKKIEYLRTKTQVKLQVPSLKDVMKLSFIQAAVVSHLQTSGRTVILGVSYDKINEVVFLLSLFLSRNESRNILPSEEAITQFHDNLFFQKILKTAESISAIPVKEESCGTLFPVTIVDVQFNNVWKLIPSDKGYKQYFHSSRDTGSIIPDLWFELLLWEKSVDEYRLEIENFMECLFHRTTSVVKVLENFINLKKTFTRTELMSMCAIDNLIDLNIILGFAEKWKPGIKNFLIK